VRSAWREAGVFDHETLTYVVEKIPRPPEARAIVERDEYGRTTVLGHEMRATCAKCFEQMIFRWQRMYSDCVVEDPHHPELMAVAVAKEAAQIAKRAEAEASGAREREHRAQATARRLEEKIARLKRHAADKRNKRSKKRRGRK
jgi:hypothetical protein